MKKALMIILALAIAAMSFTGCGANTGADSGTGDAAESVTVRLGGLKGPTTMGMVSLLDNADKGTSAGTYEFTMEAAADALTPRLLKGELDIISVPANAAANLWNKSGGAVKVIAVNTLGVISIVEKGGETVKALSDLKGKTVYATGKGTTPEYVLSYLLSTAGIDIEKDVTMVWKSEPSEVVSQMATEQNSVAMLPQPFVTSAQTKLSDLRIAIDLTSAWDSVTGGSSRLCTSVLLASTAFCEKYPEAVKTFLEEYKASSEYVNTNTEAASALIESYGIVAAAIAQKAIPHCHLVCLTGSELQSALSGYLNVLYEKNPASVGGALPDSTFYYSVTDK